MILPTSLWKIKYEATKTVIHEVLGISETFF